MAAWRASTATVTTANASMDTDQRVTENVTESSSCALTQLLLKPC